MRGRSCSCSCGRRSVGKSCSGKCSSARLYSCKMDRDDGSRQLSYSRSQSRSREKGAGSREKEAAVVRQATAGRGEGRGEQGKRWWQVTRGPEKQEGVQQEQEPIQEPPVAKKLFQVQGG